MSRVPASARRAARLALIAVSLGSVLSISACARRAEPAARPPRLVTATPVLRADFRLSSEYAARVAPELEVNVTPKVGGRVVAVLADVGSLVEKGQPLCRLDASDYEARYRQASAALEGAKASLTRTSDSGFEQQRIQAKSAADQAKVAYDDAKSGYERTKRLYDGGSVPRQQLDDVEARFKAASIQLDAANRALALVEDKGGSQANEIAAGQVDQAKAEADLAKSQLDAAVIRSPISGRISYRNIEAGEFIGTSSLIFVVIDERRVVAEAGLSERVVGSVKRGMKMSLAVPALGTQPLSGTVDWVSPASDPRTMLYTVRLLVPNPDGRLRGGMLARLEVPVETRPGALLVPERATFSENDADYVLVATPDATPPPGGGELAGTASLRRVTLGASDGTQVEVLDGLKEGELVVTAGQEFLGDGDRVSIAR